MSKISFAIIGHNEGHLLKDCLESIKDIAFEIIYVDCQSQDDSIDIAKRYNAKVFSRENNYNLNINKQFAIERCSGEWIFYIDPDERLTKELKDEMILKLKNTDACGFLIPRRNYYFGRWLRYGGKYPDRQLRLFKNAKARFECKSIHERIKVDGKVDYLVTPFEHIVIEDTRRFISKLSSYIHLGGYEVIRLGKDPRKVLFKAIRNFFLNYIFRFGFLDGMVGLFVALIDLLNGFLYYFKAMEIRKGDGG